VNAEHAADDRDDIAGETGGIGMQHIISVIEQHGLLVVFLNVLLAQSGLPLPAFPTLMAAGALLTQSRYQVHEIILSGISGSLIADLAWYWSGERYGRRILGLLCKMSLSPDFCVRQTETAFAKVGPWSLLFAKFFPGLATISVAMAGVTKMSLPFFLLLNGIVASVCERAGAARLDIPKCDHRYPLHAYGYRQVRRLGCPRRAWLVFAGKMVAAAGVYPSASHGPYQRR
jgi:membrane protein DedA with SNARE-associated domain